MTIGGIVAATLPASQSARAAVSDPVKGGSVPLAPNPAVEIAQLAPPEPEVLEAAARVPSPDGPPRWGSDWMVDQLRAMDINVIAAIPGNTFSGLHESLVNRGMLAEPAAELFTVTHEEISVAFAHGYTKVTNELSACMVHSTVGLQHASMAIYNAWCDRAPVLTITGAVTDPGSRGSYVDWLHGVSDGPSLTRDFTKFDETPRSLDHFGESLERAYRMAMTPPHGPVVLAVDMDLQEKELAEGKAPASVTKPRIIPPQGEMGALREAARLLVDAEMPLLQPDRAIHTAKGLQDLVTLAETLGAAVVDGGGRMNFPWRHPLNQSSSRDFMTDEVDVILALEVQNLGDSSSASGGPKVIAISTYDYYLKSNYQPFMQYPDIDLSIAGDSEATLPSLIEEVRKLIPASKRSAIEARKQRLAEAHRKGYEDNRKRQTLGWDITPITTARVFAEVHNQVKDMNWALVGGTHFEGSWPKHLWDATHHWQFIGDSGGMGLGYLPGAAVGAAYAHKREGRLPIVFGGDGDLMMAPGALFTAAYHQIPILYLVHNNGGYHQEVMKIQQQAGHRNRGIRRSHIGNVLPDVDYGSIARGMGMDGVQITDPGDLRAAIARALDVIANGEPALIDVVSQGR